MPPEALKISELAALAAVTPDTLRYYERLGLMPAAARTTASSVRQSARPPVRP